KTIQLIRHAVCQVSPERDWARERKLPMPLSRCFETGRRSLTQSSVEAFVSETANGCLVLHRAGTIAERQKPRAEELEKTFRAPLQSASGELLSLNKDLRSEEHTSELQSRSDL